MTQADDPWAKWRQPAGSAVPAAEKAEPPVAEKSAPARARPAKAPERPVADKRPADEAAADLEVTAEVKTKPAGTLGVKAGLRSEAPGKRTPLRGGSPVRKPMTAATPLERPAARPAKKAAAPIVRSGPPPEGTRLSKVMSERGMCSRREADLWIERGWVFVNGEQVSELGSRIDPDACIEVSTEAKKDQAKAVTILLHKPVGYVSGQPEPGCIPAVTLITAENQVPQSGGPEFKPWMLRGLAPAGRLDVDSTGLLVLTSDGRVAKRLIGEDSDAEKEYLVRVSGEMIKGGLELLRHGLELDGKALKPAWVKQLNEDQLHFILKEGKKRQIRRMCELVGLKVVGLKRVRIGRIRLGDLPMGQWRFLRADEAF
ncbi:pseudouridine synthase [Azonexus hydrophilus]|uniref:pseudouridine synthase n=1 Tax=Azonexus hydrophilus TaxID=418702 RepID=UPI00249203E5|nr:pseudouridine synthase [Azonexus hydrophilus]